MLSAVVSLITAACGNGDSGPGALAEPPESTAAPVLETTDGSIARAPRRVSASGPEVELPLVPSDPAAAWNLPAAPGRSSNLVLLEVPVGFNGRQDLPSGLTLALHSCVLAAPLVWVLEGDIEADGSLPGELVLEFHHRVSDVVTVSSALVSVDGPGAFSLVVDARPLPESGAGRAALLGRENCTVFVAGTQIGGTAAASDPAGGVRWEAPAGTVHELGMGARLSEAGPATGWLWPNWVGQGLPFAEVVVVVPDADMWVLQVAGQIDERSGCRSIRTTVQPVEMEQVDVIQWSDCEPFRFIGPRDLGAIEGHPGLFASDYGDGTAPIVHGRVAGSQLRIESQSMAAILAVLDHLELRRNLLVDPRSEGLVSAELESAIAAALAPVDGVERARIRHLDGWYVVAEATYVETGDDIGTVETPVVAEFFARPTDSGWVVLEGGAASWNRCLAAGGSSTPEGGVVWIVAGEPDWVIERLVDGVWTPLNTADGVFLESSVFTDETDRRSWQPNLTLRLADPPAECAEFG